MKAQKLSLLTLLIGSCFLPCPTNAFYNPSTGRWLSRDPIEERGGISLYAFVQNTPGNACDRLGKLALTYFHGPTRLGSCGQFSSWITWSLDNNLGASDPFAGGLIIQHVNVTFDVHVCDRQSSPLRFGPPSSFHIDPSAWPLYEGWEIPPGKSHPPREGAIAVDDYFTMPSFGISTKGSITIYATANYFDGESMPLGFFPTYSPPTGSLPTSKAFSPPGPPTSTVTRTVTATWNCCCHIENTQVASQ